MNDSKISEGTRRQLAEMFLPELHQAWWAETLAQLQDEQDAATDPAEVQAVETRIREHYKICHDVELTRKRLALPSRKEASLDQIQRLPLVPMAGPKQLP